MTITYFSDKGIAQTYTFPKSSVDYKERYNTRFDCHVYGISGYNKSCCSDAVRDMNMSIYDKRPGFHHIFNPANDHFGSQSYMEYDLPEVIDYILDKLEYDSEGEFLGKATHYTTDPHPEIVGIVLCYPEHGLTKTEQEMFISEFLKEMNENEKYSYIHEVHLFLFTYSDIILNQLTDEDILLFGSKDDDAYVGIGYRNIR